MTTGDIVAAAEALQDEAEQLAESAAENNEAALAAAAARMAEAQALAKQISDAALASELGKQITGLGERFSSWQAEMNSRFSSLETTLAEIRAQPQAPAVVVSSSSPRTQQPEAEEIPGAKNPAEETSTPQLESDDTNGADKPAAQQRKRRKI